MCNAFSTDFFLFYGYVSYSRTILNYPHYLNWSWICPIFCFSHQSMVDFFCTKPKLKPRSRPGTIQIRISATTILGKSQIIIFSGVRLYQIGFGDCLIFRRVLMATMKRAKVLYNLMEYRMPSYSSIYALWLLKNHISYGIFSFAAVH